RVQSDANRFSQAYISNTTSHTNGVIVAQVFYEVVPQPWKIIIKDVARFFGVRSNANISVAYSVCEIEVYGYPLGYTGDQVVNQTFVRAGFGSRIPVGAAVASRLADYNNYAGDVYSLPLDWPGDETFHFAMYLLSYSNFFTVYLPCAYTVTGLALQGSGVLHVPFSGRPTAFNLLFAYEPRQDMLNYYRDWGLDVPALFDGPRDELERRRYSLSNPFQAQVVQLKVLSVSGRAAVKFDLLGFPNDTNSTQVLASEMNSTWEDSKTILITFGIVYHLNYLVLDRSSSEPIQFYLSYEEVLGEDEVLKIYNTTWMVRLYPFLKRRV
uniref:Omp85 domain-containing protein n=1 Tax=Macrostomum lignano TaxID=282301 RepID=A0A1I8J0E9_9PLAT